MPEGLADTASKDPASASQAGEAAAVRPGYYYIDVYEKTQGPFEASQLAAWGLAGQLSPAMPIFFTDGFETQSFPLRTLLSADPSQNQDGNSQPQARGADEDTLTYSEVALAALPEDDETRHLAKLAADSGTTLQDVVAFCHRASRAPGCGTKQESVESVEGGRADCDSDLTRRRPPRNWKRLKKLKELKKEKQRTAWLFS